MQEIGMASFSQISILFIWGQPISICELQLTISPSRKTGSEVWLQLDYMVTNFVTMWMNNKIICNDL